MLSLQLGLVEVTVAVDEARADDFASAIDDSGSGVCSMFFLDFGNGGAFDQEVDRVWYHMLLLIVDEEGSMLQQYFCIR